MEAFRSTTWCQTRLVVPCSQPRDDRRSGLIAAATTAETPPSSAHSCSNVSAYRRRQAALSRITRRAAPPVGEFGYRWAAAALTVVCRGFHRRTPHANAHAHRRARMGECTADWMKRLPNVLLSSAMSAMVRLGIATATTALPSTASATCAGEPVERCSRKQRRTSQLCTINAN